MKTHLFELRLTFLVFGCFLLFSLTNLNAQNTKTEEKSFKLGPTKNERIRFEFEVEHPGEIQLLAYWKGSDSNLALILNGPGKTGAYARKDGASPLKINFKVSPEHIRTGKKWIVSIVNFGVGSRVYGNLKITFPSKNTLDKTDVLGPGTGISTVSTNPPTTLPEITENIQENGIKRSIMEDGTVEIRYPDGTIKRVTSGGYIIIKPDGTQMGAQYINIPPEIPPQLPSDQRIRDYMEWQSESLLDLIKKTLHQDEASISNYLEHENEVAPGIYHKLHIRTSYLDMLLSN